VEIPSIFPYWQHAHPILFQPLPSGTDGLWVHYFFLFFNPYAGSSALWYNDNAESFCYARFFWPAVSFSALHTASLHAFQFFAFPPPLLPCGLTIFLLVPTFFPVTKFSSTILFFYMLTTTDVSWPPPVLPSLFFSTFILYLLSPVLRDKRTAQRFLPGRGFFSPPGRIVYLIQTTLTLHLF